MEHRLVVATVGLYCERLIGYENGLVTYFGKAIEQPLLLMDDGTFGQ